MAEFLLPPDSPALRSRPVYVALIEAMCDATWLVVPFGRLPLPALPGELATEPVVCGAHWVTASGFRATSPFTSVVSQVMRGLP